MSAEHKESGGVPFIVKLVIGLGLMFGGFYVYKNVKIGFFQTLAEQGINIEPGKTIAVIGVLLIVFPVIQSFYLKPLQDAIDERNSNLEQTFTEAETLRTDMTKMKADYEAQLAETEAKARVQIQEEVRKAQEMRQQLMADASAKAEEMKKRAQDEIDSERERVMTELRLKTVDLTLSATQRLIGENLDDARNRKLIEEFIEKAEVPVR